MSKHKAEKDFVEDIKKRHPRVEFYGLHYYEICRDAYTLVKQINSKVKKMRSRMPKPVNKDGRIKLYRLGQKGRALLEEISKQESIAVAFAAMCLEACIWDYAASTTSQNKADQNFGSLNLVAKWVVIPQLLCGSDITKERIDDTCLLDRLRKLKKARDSFVHSKSKPLPNKLRATGKNLRFWRHNHR